MVSLYSVFCLLAVLLAGQVASLVHVYADLNGTLHVGSANDRILLAEQDVVGQIRFLQQRISVIKSQCCPCEFNLTRPYPLSYKQQFQPEKHAGASEDLGGWVVANNAIVVSGATGTGVDRGYNFPIVFDRPSTSAGKQLKSDEQDLLTESYGTAAAIGFWNGTNYIAVASADYYRVFVYTNATRPSYEQSQLLNGKYGFGHAIALDARAKRMIVTTWATSAGSEPEGEVQVYTRVPGDHQFANAITLTSPSNVTLGASLAVAGETGSIIVVSGYDSTQNLTNGTVNCVYVYRLEWNGVHERLQRLNSPGATAGTAYGHAVAAHGDRIVVGAYLAGKVGGGIAQGRSGLVYVFQRVGPEYAYAQTLYPPTPFGNTLFGLSVAVLGNTIAVGGRDDTQGACAFMYELQATGIFDAMATLQAPVNPMAYGELHSSVALNSDTVFLGVHSPRDDKGLGLFGFRHDNVSKT